MDVVNSRGVHEHDLNFEKIQIFDPLTGDQMITNSVRDTTKQSFVGHQTS